MKITLWIALACFLLLAGFAAGFPIGKTMGFNEGGEWALVQADIVAREAGVFMPVIYEEGQFRVIIKQPPDLYKRAWRLADKYDEQRGKVGNKEIASNNDSKPTQLIRQFTENPDEIARQMKAFDPMPANGAVLLKQGGTVPAPGTLFDAQWTRLGINVEM